MIVRLLFIAAPLFGIYALQSLVFYIYWELAIRVLASLEDFTKTLYAELAGLILDGICWVAIVATLVSTMNIPNVQWTSQRIGGSSDSKSHLNESGYHKSQI